MGEKKKIGRNNDFLAVYGILNRYYGDLHWWPGDSPFEVAVGAILTQNTAWSNVEKAISRLKAERVLDPWALNGINETVLAEFIRPSGYFRVKAKRLKAFLGVLCREFKGEMGSLLSGSVLEARKRLLDIPGVGEETADSILLYAGERPIFVVDAYTRRIFSRHGLVDQKNSYSDIQKQFMAHIPRSPRLYNQYHAAIVETGKRFCRREPRCVECPLGEMKKPAHRG